MNKKIALVIKDFDPKKGGGERYSVNLARELKKKNLAFDVIARSVSPELEKEFSVRLIHPKRSWFSKSLAFNEAFQNEISSSEYNCVVGLTQITPCRIYRAGGGLLSEWEKIHFRGILGNIRKWFSLNHKYSLKLEQEILMNPGLKHIVVNSELVRLQFMKAYPHLTDRLVYIGNGIDRALFYPRNWNREIKQSFFRKKGIKGGEIVLLFVANNFRRKGIFHLIEALSLFKNRERFRLIVAGNGRIRQVRAFAWRKNVLDLLHFTGPVYSELNEWYNASDVFMLPTLYDPCSNSCLEAMACGTPVVTTDLNGASMYLEKGGGMIVNSGSITSGILEAFHWIDSFWHEWDEVRQKAVQAVAPLTISKNAEQMLSLIH
ncbi:MAG: glycosyltransferase family 4 protein [Candidatus Aureabacteria bacterium]|nr:glycosyltransferase family 4 protein [Candidatus Auribacterota bacterium]